MGEMSIHDQLVMMQNEARYDEDAAAGEEDPSIREYRCARSQRSACGKAINGVWRVLPTLSLTFGFQPFRCLRHPRLALQLNSMSGQTLPFPNNRNLLRSLQGLPSYSSVASIRSPS